MSPRPHPELPLDPDQPPPHLTFTGVATVFGGGMIGTLARWGVGEVVPPWGVWPAATFCVNVVGAFLLGALLEALGRRGPDVGLRQRLRLLVGTGFMGAFTTYSTLALDTDLLVRDGHPWVGVAYAGASVVLGFLATVLGIRLAAGRARSEGVA